MQAVVAIKDLPAAQAMLKRLLTLYRGELLSGAELGTLGLNI